MVTGDDLVTLGVLNSDYLHAIYGAAYFDCEQYSDGDCIITERGLKCIATLRHHDEIDLAIVFQLKTDISSEKKLECANRINDRYIITRASVTKDASVLVCDYHIFLKGGVSRKAIVLGTRKFIEVTRQAVDEYASDIIQWHS